MRPAHLIDGLGIVELDIKVLVNALERAANLHLVLELHRNLVLDERLEETSTRSAGSPSPGRPVGVART